MLPSLPLLLLLLLLPGRPALQGRWGRVHPVWARPVPLSTGDKMDYGSHAPLQEDVGNIQVSDALTVPGATPPPRLLQLLLLPVPFTRLVLLPLSGYRLPRTTTEQ